MGQINAANLFYGVRAAEFRARDEPGTATPL